MKRQVKALFYLAGAAGRQDAMPLPSHQGAAVSPHRRHRSFRWNPERPSTPWDSGDEKQQEQEIQRENVEWGSPEAATGPGPSVSQDRPSRCALRHRRARGGSSVGAYQLGQGQDGRNSNISRRTSSLRSFSGPPCKLEKQVLWLPGPQFFSSEKSGGLGQESMQMQPPGAVLERVGRGLRRARGLLEVSAGPRQSTDAAGWPRPRLPAPGLPASTPPTVPSPSPHQ